MLSPTPSGAAQRASLFSLLTLEHCRDIVQKLQSEEARLNRQMYDGDHWLSGTGWIGPKPKVGDSEYGAVFDKIRRAFVSQNVVREIARRHRSALVGREPLYGVTPKINIDKYKSSTGQRASDPPPRRATLNRFVQSAVKNNDPDLTSPESQAQRTLAQEVEDALDTWFDKRECHNILRAAVVSLMLETRAPLRLFVPPNRMREIITENGKPAQGIQAKTLEEALSYIYLQHPATTQATVITDPGTMEKGGIFIDRELSGDNMAEVIVQNMGVVQAVQMTMNGQSVNPNSGNNPDLLPGAIHSDAPDMLSARDAQAGNGRSLLPGNEFNVAEIYYTEPREGTEYTVFRVLRKDKPAQIAAMQMGGNLPVYEMRADPLITTQIRQNQFQLNRTLTMMGHNVDLAGFVERTVINAEVPVGSGGAGSDNDADEDADAPVRGENYRLEMGAARTTFLRGIVIEDAEGRTAIANPSMVYRDPVSPEPLIEAIKRSYMNMLQEAQQMHVLISGDQPISGEARRQAMADFVMSLLELRPIVEAALRWIIETALGMAAAFMGEPGRYDALRATADVRIEASPLMAEDMRMILGMVAQRLMSKETAMIRFNIEDPEAERQRILDDLQDMMDNPLLMPAQADPAGAGSDLVGNDPNPEQTNPSSTPKTGTQ